MTSTAPAPASGPPMAALPPGATPRQNSHGDPCPSWCQTNHSKPFSAVHVKVTASIEHIWAFGTHHGDENRAGINASLPDPAARWPSLTLDPGKAEDLAVIVELLADASPDEHRQLADGIRQAVALVTGPSDA
jgi:hypothetical protein